MIAEKGITAEDNGPAGLLSGSTYNIWGVVTFFKVESYKGVTTLYLHMNMARCSFAVFIFL